MSESGAHRNSLNNRIKAKWLGLTISSKLKTVAALGVIIILISVLLDIWTIKISLFDFRYSLSSNEAVGEAVQTIENESAGFRDYVMGVMPLDELRKLEAATEKAIVGLPYDYLKMGEERYAWTSKIKHAYSVYKKNCDAFLALGENNTNYLQQEYELYDMQNYLKSYASNLMSLTTVSSNVLYQRLFPRLIVIPIVIIVVGAILIGIIVKATEMLNESFVEPLIKLAGASKRIALNDTGFDDIEVENHDEMGDLVHAFNKMKHATGQYIATLEQNRETLDRLHAEELQKKEIENQLEKMKFEVLRHQINPHFLFNTLNVISGMARLEDAAVTDKMIKALSSLFRYNLRTDDKETVLEQEMAVIKDYMYLQSMRFGDRIKYEIDCDPRVNDAYVPSFSIQPFVENSIVHGLADKEEGGLIRISAVKSSDETPYLIIKISDTGVGMTKAELDELKSRFDDEKDLRRSIGIGNIYRRLSLMYPDSSLDIESVKGEGTTVTIKVPYISNL